MKFIYLIYFYLCNMNWQIKYSTRATENFFYHRKARKNTLSLRFHSIDGLTIAVKSHSSSDFACDGGEVQLLTSHHKFFFTANVYMWHLRLSHSIWYQISIEQALFAFGRYFVFWLVFQSEFWWTFYNLQNFTRDMTIAKDFQRIPKWTSK